MTFEKAKELNPELTENQFSQVIELVEIFKVLKSAKTSDDLFAFAIKFDAYLPL